MVENKLVIEPKALQSALQPLLDLRIVHWKGLPEVKLEVLVKLFGEANKVEDTTLGLYPAQRLVYSMTVPSGGLIVYTRNRKIILVETLALPPLTIIEELGKPDAILPHEILAEDAYVHEYLYCQKGLVLSVAQSFSDAEQLEIKRCRGIQPINNPKEFGPELYLAFEDTMLW